MTIAEKIEMYKGKRDFVKNISKAFEAKPSVSTVTSVDYEVYKKEINADNTYFIEYIIVNFFGGSKAVKIANGNSCTANLRVIGFLVDGDYYEEVRDYETLIDDGFTPVDLDTNEKLSELLAIPMSHISDIRRCFNCCENGKDVERVIAAIPAGFGTFEVEYSEDEEFFTIRNTYVEDNTDWTEIIEYEFYRK